MRFTSLKPGRSNFEESSASPQARIQGALSNLGHELARSTIAEILGKARNRAGAGTESENDLEGIF